MLHWTIANKYRSKDSSALHPIQTTYQALLSSIIADGDVVTDWIYYFEILHSEVEIPQWLLLLHLVSCIFGTLSWLSVATDGRLVYWVKVVFAMLISCLFSLILLPISIAFYSLVFITYVIFRFCFSEENKVRKFFYEKVMGNREQHPDEPLWLGQMMTIKDRALHKPTFSSSTLLFLGIILEDIPQLVVTFLIEDKIKSDDPTTGGVFGVSGAATVNLTFAIFDIFHKIAEACDLLYDVHNTGYVYKKWIKAHSVDVNSLSVAGGNSSILSSVSFVDGSLRLWNTTQNNFKLIQQIKWYNSAFNDAVLVGSSKVITACIDKTIRLFNFETGELVPDVSSPAPIELEFEPNFIILSSDSKSIFTSGMEDPHSQYQDASGVIQQFDLHTNECLATYNKGASSLTFLDDDTFVSSACEYTNAFVWNVNILPRDPVARIELEVTSYGAQHNVMAMSPTMFLIGDGCSVKAYGFDDNGWTCKITFNEHTSRIQSLSKVNDSLFVSTSWDRTAKLWDITKSSNSVFTFRAHKTNIFSSVFLQEEKAIATGDGDGNIAIWSISKYLENDQEEEDENQENSASVTTQENIITANHDDNRNHNLDIAEP